MTTLTEAWQAGIGAVIADNGLSRAAFVDALQTVITAGFSQSEGVDFVNAVAVEYGRLAILGNGNYNNLRGDIVSRGAVTSLALFEALAVLINMLPESEPANQAIALGDLRAARDEVATSITTLQGFRTGATRQVKDALNLGVNELQREKENLRSQIQSITGDPDN